jgi:hypothetical protein
LTLLGLNYNTNFGAVLQAYALQRVLKEHFNIPADLINYSPQTQKRRPILKIIKEDGIFYLFNRVFMYFKNNYLLSKIRSMRDKNTKNFLLSHLNFTNDIFTDLNDFDKISNEKARFVVGSDIIWSPKVHVSSEQLKIFLLSFVNSGTKISYAASVEDLIPEHLKPMFKEYLADFDFISVREKSFAIFLRDVLDFEPEIVLDPTLLLSPEEWVKIAKPPEKLPKKPYILVYDVPISKEVISNILKFAKKEGFNVVTYSYLLFKQNVMSFYPYGPQEFLWLIANADYVITSSFHGTVFSTIFEKPFIADTSVTKIKDYLELLEVESQRLDNSKNINISLFEGIDWDSIQKKLKKERRHSINYLKKALRR